MSGSLDIARLIKFMQAAFPNYQPEENAAEALLILLGDIPAEALMAAVMALCAEAREFAPSAGCIRERVALIRLQAECVPNEFEAWQEICRMPQSMTRAKVIMTEENKAAEIIHTPLHWSHPVVEKVAGQLGWPDFPGVNESTDRAHFLQAYRLELARYAEEKYRLPQVKQYLEANASPQVKQLVQKLEK